MKGLRLIISIVLLQLWGGCFAACSPAEKKVIVQRPEPLAVAEWMAPDSIALGHLGNRLSNLLLNASKVLVYRLTPREQVNSDDVEIVPHFVRDTLLGTLNKEQMAILKYSLISCGANYFNDSTLIPLAPYYPIIEFEFERKKQVAHVFVSLSDFKWGVNFDGKQQFLFNYADCITLHRICNYFLNRPKTEVVEQKKTSNKSKKK